MRRLGTSVLFGAILAISTIVTGIATAAPYAAMVVDARSGEVLHSRNADTQLHPASLTKMMTLYVTFEALENGELSLDTVTTISKNAAAEPPSKLYLKAGQKIRIRDLIRAAAIKSANDAATALAEAVGGNEQAFVNRMNRTAKALGMSRTNFRNAHGLTMAGHLSTARDMTTLGRHLFYDYPEYYNLFSRRTTNAGGKTIANTNRKFLAAYQGADGIKTGYTNAAGFNLVASAERGNERIIATMFGGTSTAARNARVAELLDMGFSRAPSRVAVDKPRKPSYGTYAKATRQNVIVAASSRPQMRPLPAATQVAALAEVVNESVEETLREIEVATAASTAAVPAVDDAVEEAVTSNLVMQASLVPSARPTSQSAVVAEPEVVEIAASPAATFAATASPEPAPRPVVITFSSSDSAAPVPQPASASAAPVTVTRSAGAGGWGIDVGLFASRYEAERILLKTALLEIETLDDAERLVERRPQGFAATFTGLNERTATLACQRLTARKQDCATIQPQ